MSTISSTTSAIERAPSENTSSGWAPSPFTLTLFIHAHQRHQLAAVLHHVAAVREFDLAGVDFLKPRDQRQRHRLGLRWNRRGTPAARWSCSAARGVAGLRRLRRPPSATSRVAPSACAMPFGSMIMITAPSPRMVLPENMRDVAQLARHRLHHDFLGVKHAVDDDAESLAADLGHDDKAALDIAGPRHRCRATGSGARAAAACHAGAARRYP